MLQLAAEDWLTEEEQSVDQVAVDKNLLVEFDHAVEGNR
jgi:hypothetical protein